MSPTALSRADRQRAATLSGRRRVAFLTGRQLLAETLSQTFGSGRGTTARCPDCGGWHGAVRVEGVPAVASLSYAGNLVAVAVAPTSLATELGIDAATTTADPKRDHDLAQLLGVDPSTALHRWTQIEAVLKASGHGLRLDPAQVQVEAGSAILGRTGRQYQLASAVTGTGQLVSIAWRAIDH